MHKRYYSLHLIFIIPLLTTLLASGSGLVLIYNLSNIKDLSQAVYSLRYYLMWSIFFSFLVGLALAYAIIIPLRRLDRMSASLVGGGASDKKRGPLDFEREVEEVFRSFQQVDSSLATERKKELLQRITSLGLLAAGVAHELRNPLGSIKGLTTLIDEELAEGDHKKNYTQVVLKEVARLEQTIDRFLTLIPSKSEHIDPEEIGLNALLDETISLAQFNPLAKEIEIKRDLRPLKVLGFREKLRQVFLNLILNAYQAMPEGGVLTISGRSNDIDKTVQLVFSDAGAGIDVKDINKIWDPFFTTKDNNTGLGLTIVRQIISEHRGEISAESKKGEGARFIITLPGGKDEPE